MKWNRWWTGGAALIVLAGAAGGYWWWTGKETKPLQAALQTTQVRIGDLEVKISGTGNIEVANRQSLKSSSSGTIASVKVKQGDKVKKGQVLAEFEQKDTSSVDNQIRSKQLDLKKKRLDLENLQTQFKEAPDDDKRAEISISIQKQQLEIETAVSDIETLKDEDSSIEPITAPMDGTLATFDIAEGDTVGGQGGSASSLGEVVDYDHLQMIVGVDELDISKVKLNQQATVLVEALADRTFTGKVSAIAQEGKASNGVSSFDVTITLDEVADLKAGMSAEASILTEQKTDALYLPVEAVQSFGNRYFVMVPSANGTAAEQGQGQAPQQQQAGQAPQQQQGQEPQRQNARSGDAAASNRQNRQPSALMQSGVTRVSVEVGIHNEDFIEIVSGLKEGDRVVVPTTVGSSGTQNGSSGMPGFGIGGGAGFPAGPQGGGFPGGGGFNGGGNRTSGGGTSQGGGSRG